MKFVAILFIIITCVSCKPTADDVEQQRDMEGIMIALDRLDCSGHFMDCIGNQWHCERTNNLTGTIYWSNQAAIWKSKENADEDKLRSYR